MSRRVIIGALALLSSALSGCATGAFHNNVAQSWLLGHPRRIESLRSVHIGPGQEPELVVSLDTGRHVVVSRAGMRPLAPRHELVRGEVWLDRGSPPTALAPEDTLECLSPERQTRSTVAELLALYPPDFVVSTEPDPDDLRTATLTLCEASAAEARLDLHPVRTARIRTEERDANRLWWLVPFVPCYALTAAVDIATLPVTLPLFVYLTYAGH